MKNTWNTETQPSKIHKKKKKQYSSISKLPPRRAWRPGWCLSAPAACGGRRLGWRRWRTSDRRSDGAPPLGDRESYLLLLQSSVLFRSPPFLLLSMLLLLKQLHSRETIEKNPFDWITKTLTKSQEKRGGEIEFQRERRIRRRRLYLFICLFLCLCLQLFF